MKELVLGAVAYDPKVVLIWAGFRRWCRSQGFDFDYVLYSNYERQVEDLIDGALDVAWNSPLAWVRARRLATAKDLNVRPVVMRDSDRDLTTAVIARADGPVHSLKDLIGHTIGTGAIDSPQATLLPLSFLRAYGLNPGQEIMVRRFDVGVGLHGDHIGGERDAAIALLAGEVDAACVTDSNLLTLSKEGTLPVGSITVLGKTPKYDHCNMTSGPAVEDLSLNTFADLLLSMSYADPEIRPLLDLEGLKAWVPGRTANYGQLERAIDDAAFYDASGEIIDHEYRP